MNQLLARIFRNPGLALELAGATFFINILALAAPLFFILVFNRYMVGGVDGTLITLTVGMVIAVLIQWAFKSIRTRLAGEVGLQPDEPLVKAVYDAFTRSKSHALAQIQQSRIVQAANGLQAMHAGYSVPNVNAVLDLPFSLLFLGVIFLLSPQLGVVAALGAGLTLGAALVSSARSSTPASMLQSQSAANSVLINSLINNPDTARAFGGANRLSERWTQQLKDIFTLRRFSAHNEDMSQSTLMALGLFTRAGIIALGARQVVMGELSIGALIGISFMASLPLTILSRFSRARSALARAQEAQTMLQQLFRLPREKLTGSALENYSGALAFKDLAFTYPGAKTPLFESLNLTVRPGDLVGVTGPNGAGKSTLARMTAGLLEPSRGGIMVDGLDLTQISLEWWRSRIIYLPQEPGFIPGTFRENVLAACPELDNITLNRILAETGLRKFLDAHPQGLDLELSENGRPLPLGIRRRLALARAMTTDGRLAILDEPAEGLDLEGWKMVKTVINRFRQDKRTVLIFSSDPRLFLDASSIVDLGQKPVPAITFRQQEPAVGGQ